ncbi:MAG: hypothetical protein RLZ17_685, partial [Actinomycetota bacterium]
MPVDLNNATSISLAGFREKTRKISGDASNANVVIAIILILFVCVKHKKIALWVPILAISATLIIGLIAVNFSLAVMGWVTIAIGTPAIIPQVVRVY